jgi:hypothetical protein
VSVSFDNLGEAAEIELGLRAADDPMGDHFSVVTALPRVLEELATAELRATFFVEGLNAIVYPDALKTIAANGHEVAYHGFRHEEWTTLTPESEADNLARGVTAFRELDLAPTGFRPPGGVLSDASLSLMRDHGISYCSPAGNCVSSGEVVLLPFAWHAVDAYHVLPAFGALREHLDGEDTARGLTGIREGLLDAITGALETGGHACLVLHNWMVEGERELLADVFAEIQAGSRRGELWIARCDEAAYWISEHEFPATTQLDTTPWMAPQ